MDGESANHEERLCNLGLGGKGGVRVIWLSVSHSACPSHSLGLPRHCLAAVRLILPRQSLWSVKSVRHTSQPPSLWFVRRQQVIRVYSLPEGTFSSDEDEEEEEEEDDEEEEGEIGSATPPLLHGL